MKKILLLLVSLTLTSLLFAQEEGEKKPERVRFDPPTEVNGFKVRYATLSKGKYPEIFNNDTIQQIGSVYFNRVIGEVVGEVERDSLFYPVHVNSRWWSPDPLAHEFTSISPYVFVENNPINLIDPDGRAPIKPTPYQVKFHLQTTQSYSIYQAVRNGQGFGFEALTNVVNGGGNWNRAVGAFAEGIFADRLRSTTTTGSGIMGGIRGLFSANINTNIYLSPDDRRYQYTDVIQTVQVGKDATFTYPILQNLSGVETSKKLGKGNYTFLYEVKASDSDFTLVNLTRGINQLITTMENNQGTGENLIPILAVDGGGFSKVLNEIAQNPTSKNVQQFLDSFKTLTTQYNGGINIEHNLKQEATNTLIDFKTDVNRTFK